MGGRAEAGDVGYAVQKAAMVGDEMVGSGWIGRAARLEWIRWHCDQDGRKLEAKRACRVAT